MITEINNNIDPALACAKETALLELQTDGLIISTLKKGLILGKNFDYRNFHHDLLVADNVKIDREAYHSALFRYVDNDVVKISTVMDAPEFLIEESNKERHAAMNIVGIRLSLFETFIDLNIDVLEGTNTTIYFNNKKISSSFSWKYGEKLLNSVYINFKDYTDKYNKYHNHIYNHHISSLGFAKYGIDKTEHNINISAFINQLRQKIIDKSNFKNSQISDTEFNKITQRHFKVYNSERWIKYGRSDI